MGTLSVPPLLGAAHWYVRLNWCYYWFDGQSLQEAGVGEVDLDDVVDELFYRR